MWQAKKIRVKIRAVKYCMGVTMSEKSFAKAVAEADYPGISLKGTVKVFYKSNKNPIKGRVLKEDRNGVFIETDNGPSRFIPFSSIEEIFYTVR